MSIDWNNLFATWYMWLSSLNATLSEPIRELSDGLGLPFVSAFLFGLLGTTAPCQLSTNFGALAFLSRHPSDKAATLRATLAFVTAKVLVYTVLGILVLATGRQVMSVFGPYLDLPRKIIGPLMVLLGLAVLGVLRTRLQFGQVLATRLAQQARSQINSGKGRANRINMPSSQRAYSHVPAQAKVGIGIGSSAATIAPAAHTSSTSPAFPMAGTSYETTSFTVPDMTTVNAPGVRPAFLLGMGFSLAFCPTLLLLFFGVTMTLASRSAAGFTFPAFFALGTALPLVLFIGLALTSAKAAARLRRGMRRANRPLRWLGGVALILLGLHDTFIYWFL